MFSIRTFRAVIHSVFLLAAAGATAAGMNDGRHLRRTDAYADQSTINEYLKSKKEEFYANIERRFLPKIIYDIQEILAHGWADKVSPRDFAHVHLMFSRLYPNSDDGQYPGILSGDDILLLYHSHEYDSKIDSPNRNILASLGREPAVVAGTPHGIKTLPDGSRKIRNTADDSTLKTWYVCEIDFAMSRRGLIDAYNVSPNGDPEPGDPHPFEREYSLGPYFFGLNCAPLR